MSGLRRCEESRERERGKEKAVRWSPNWTGSRAPAGTDNLAQLVAMFAPKFPINLAEVEVDASIEQAVLRAMVDSVKTVHMDWQDDVCVDSKISINSSTPHSVF